jgi:DNA-3-methyladenine glycosylase
VRPGQAALSASALRASFGAPLPESFYDRPTPTVARDLLGRWLVVRDRGRYRGGRIVETEAYVGRTDPASHSYRGATARNASMFATPGTLYVYRIHQVHCANTVTREGQAVLLRAAEGLTAGLGSLSGPGRLCRELGIERSDDGSSLLDGRVRVLPGGPVPTRIQSTRRVGISRAVERRLRFVWAGHAALSHPRHT